MELSCLHTHTGFCDGKGEIEDFCTAAAKKNFSSIGFSAHAPIEKKTGLKSDWNLKEEKLYQYIDAVLTAKKHWQGKLKIFLGLEIDFIPGLTAPWDDDFKKLNLDYSIASVHYVLPRNGRLFTVDGSAAELETGLKQGFNGDKEALVNAYWDSVIKMMEGGPFDILGHVDLIKKNNKSCSLFDESDKKYSIIYDKISDLAFRNSIIPELNTGGMNRGKTNEPYPGMIMLRKFREKNLPVTLNADAHKASDIDGHYEDAFKYLKEAGYSETLILDKRENGKCVWKPVRLE